MLVRLLGCVILLSFSGLNAQETGVHNRITQANALLASGAFEACYDTIYTTLDTTGISQEELFDVALLRMICAREMRSGRRTRRALEALMQLRDALEDTLYRYPEYLLETAYSQTRIGQWDAARHWIERSDAFASYASQDDRFHGYLHYIKATVAQYADGDIEEAGKQYSEGLRRLTDAGEAISREAAQCHKGLGWYARNSGDFEEGVRAYEREIQVLDQMYADSNFEIAAAYYNLGNIFYEMGAWQNALDAYLTAHPVWNRTYAPGARFMRFLNEAIGDMYWELGMYSKAVRYYDLSIVGEEPVNNDLAETMALTGDTSALTGDYDAALQYYQRALAWRNTHFGSDHPLTGACNNFVARVYNSRGEDALALHTYHTSLYALSAEFQDSSIYALPSLEQVHYGGEQYIVEALEAKAGLLWGLREVDSLALEAAWHHLELAMAIIDRVRQNPITEASKLFWSDRAFPVYELAMEVALARNPDDAGVADAFRISERSKAFILLTAMQSAVPGNAAGVPETLLTRERHLREDLETYGGRVLLEEKRCGDARDKKLDSWKRRLHQLELDYNRFLDSLRQAYPAYYQLKYDVDVVSLEEMQQELDPTEGALVYFEGRRNLYVFAITAQDARLKRIPVDSNYLSTLGALHQSIQSPLNTTWRSDADAIFSQVVAPVLAIVRDLPFLLVIPDGALSYLPFEIFDLGDGTGRWIDHFSTSYAQSATVLFQVRASLPAAVRASFVGFAPDYQGGQPLGRGLGPLKYNKLEIRAAASHFRSAKTFTGEYATRASFVANAGNAAILHLAMHAEIDEETPLLSRLLFTTDTTTDIEQLYAYELQALKLKAQLAVLSACNTGTGQLHRGEGVMSMARSLQYAGCPSVITTLWSVDDLASSQLMEQFTYNLSQGLTKPEALRLAKQTYLEDADPATAHPFYWAGFTLIGNGDPVVFARGMTALQFGLMFGLLAVMLWAVGGVRP